MAMTVAEYFEGKEVFITGATGFIGKVLVEKLLRSCPGIKGVHCLIRPKKGQTACDRLKSLLEEKLFESLHTDQPEFTSKCHAIHGDVLESGLGIKVEDRHYLEQNIAIVFHSAATVKFDEPLRQAVEMNVVAVRRIVELCKKISGLQALVHVSTAYANCDQDVIDEVVYPSPVAPSKVIDALSWMTDDMVDKITPKLLGKKPNTYTFTKQLAENLLMDEGASLPIAIIRPSIVTASWREPFPGWIDNWNGPSGLYIATGKGLLRSMVGDRGALADIVPVDLVVNSMVSVAWYTGTQKPTSSLVYNMTTGGQNPFTWGEMQSMVSLYFKRNPLNACFRRPQIRILTPNSFLHDCWVLISHLIPAYAADLAYTMMGRKPRMVKIYNKLHRALGTLEYFTSNEWEWTSNNSDVMRAVLSEEDKKAYYTEAKGLHWPTYIENYCLGTKKFILKEDLSAMPAARAHIRKLRNIRYLFNTVMLVVAWRVLIARSQLARNSWYLVLGLVFKFVRFFRITSTISTR